MNHNKTSVESTPLLDDVLELLPFHYIGRAIELLAENNDGECPYSKPYIRMVRKGDRSNTEILNVLLSIVEETKAEKAKLNERIQKIGQTT